MKIVKLFILCLFTLCTISSCEVYSYATTQDDIYIESETDIVKSNVNFDIIIRYGTPFYVDNILRYYLYNNIYYYPFYYNNYWYLRAYRRPFNHLDYHPYFRPHRYDYRFDRGYTPHHNWYKHNPSRTNYKSTYQSRRGNNVYHRPNGNHPDIVPQKRYTLPNNGTRKITTNRGSGSRVGNFGGSRSSSRQGARR